MSKPKKKYYRKRVDFFKLLNKIKLWPSRSGFSMGSNPLSKKGPYAAITTHCGHELLVLTSKNSRQPVGCATNGLIKPAGPAYTRLEVGKILKNIFCTALWFTTQ